MQLTNKISLRKMFFSVSDIGDLELKSDYFQQDSNPMTSVLLTSPADTLPQSYKRLEGAKATEL